MPSSDWKCECQECVSGWMTDLTDMMVDKPKCGFPFGENLFGQALEYPKTRKGNEEL